jgi:acetoin utilization deacetylase AcuC-like enzyme
MQPLHQYCQYVVLSCLVVQTATAVLAVLDAVLSGTQQCGMCLVRPPGHHVLPCRPMGFGLVNFMAVAAAYALRVQTHILVKKVSWWCLGSGRWRQRSVM